MMTSKKSKFKKLSIVIVNYQSRHHLEKCLFSVRKKIFTKIKSEVILINNDSRENLEEFVKNFPGLKLVENWENKGLSASWNLGRKFSEGEIICFLNPDTEILSENIEKLLQEFEKNNELGILGPRLIDKNGQTQSWSAGRRVSLMDVILNNLGFLRSRKIWKSSQKREVDWVSGAAFFIRKSWFDLLGGFDENFFLYFEDVDFCQRMADNRKKIIYFPCFEVGHWCGGSHSNAKKQKENYYQSQDYFFQKHRGTFESRVLKILRKIVLKK